MNSIKRGDIYYVTKYATTGDEIQTGRPAVVVSNDILNETSYVIEVCFLTLREKKPLPTHVLIDKGECKGSTVICEQINSVSIERIGDKMCELSEEEMGRVDRALLHSLNLAPTQINESLKGLSDSIKPFEDEISKTEERALLAEAEVAHYKKIYNELLDRIMR